MRQVCLITPSIIVEFFSSEKAMRPEEPEESWANVAMVINARPELDDTLVRYLLSMLINNQDRQRTWTREKERGTRLEICSGIRA